jgi:putative ABC transport system permease protein
VARLGTEFPAWVTFGLDLHFAIFTVAVTSATALLFGVAPALLVSRTEPGSSLQVASGRSTPSAGRVRATNLLVGIEVALACVLLVMAGLNLRDTRALMAVAPGFRTENVLSYVIQVPEERYPSGEERAAFWAAHVERVAALPGVLEAGATTILPLRGHTGYFFHAQDAPPRGENDPNPVVLVRSVTPGYLETMDVRIVSGRTFTRFDGLDDGSAVVAVNETFVREFLGHVEQPIGARIRTGGSDAPWWTVVAVTADTKHYGLDEEARPGVFVPLQQLFVPTAMTATAHTAGPPSQLVDAARAVLAEQDPGIAMFRVATMADVMSEALWSRRAAAWLIAVFAAAALLLAVAGIYGVISYGVRQRVQEIGIRMAMGARREQVAARILREGMSIVVAGVVIGLGLALAATPVIGSILFATSPTDPWVYGGVAALILCVAAAATVVPARRAAGLDAMVVLRGE